MYDYKAHLAPSATAVDEILKQLTKINEQTQTKTAVIRKNGNEIYLNTTTTNLRKFNMLLNHTHRLPLTNLFCNDEIAINGHFTLYYTYSHHLQNCHFIITVPITPEEPNFPSITKITPAADKYEREIRDLFALEPLEHPNPTDLIYHGNWQNHPPHLRKSVTDLSQPPLPEAKDVPEPALITIDSPDVYQIPVGPIHAGVIEPGHFRFTVAGEPIINLQTKMHYTHKGTEKLAEQMTVQQGFFLSERISGDETFANSFAYCLAAEKIAKAEVPLRAQHTRIILAELERIISHFGDLSGIAGDTANLFLASQFNMLRIMGYNLAHYLTNTRFLRSTNKLGGVRKDFLKGKESGAVEQLKAIRREIIDTTEIAQNDTMFLDRLEHTGVLYAHTAYDLNATGIAGRASGLDYDVRKNHPYSAYDQFKFAAHHLDCGDVSCRFNVRLSEALSSVNLMLSVIDGLKDGEISVPLPDKLPPYEYAYGITEAARGENMHWLMVGENNTIYRYKVRTPSFCNWTAVPYAVNTNLVPDFPLINKSFNLSYSGNDL